MRETFEGDLWRFTNGQTDRSNEKVAHGFLLLGKFADTVRVTLNLKICGYRRTRELECGAVREKGGKKRRVDDQHLTVSYDASTLVLGAWAFERVQLCLPHLDTDRVTT